MATVESIRNAPAQEIHATLVCNRITKGAVRFVEAGGEWPLQIYLRKEQVEALGVAAEEGATIKLKVESV